MLLECLNLKPNSPPISPMTVPKFVAAKGRIKKLSVLTAYDFVFASLFDQAGVDAILVGDSLGMVVQGKSTTMPVTLEQMIYHGEIVARAASRSLVIVDLPFMSYQVSPLKRSRMRVAFLKKPVREPSNWKEESIRRQRFRHWRRRICLSWLTWG